MGGSPTYEYLNGLRKLTPISRENLDKIKLNLYNFQRLSTLLIFCFALIYY